MPRVSPILISKPSRMTTSLGAGDLQHLRPRLAAAGCGTARRRSPRQVSVRFSSSSLTTASMTFCSISVSARFGSDAAAGAAEHAVDHGEGDRRVQLERRQPVERRASTRRRTPSGRAATSGTRSRRTARPRRCATSVTARRIRRQRRRDVAREAVVQEVQRAELLLRDAVRAAEVVDDRPPSRDRRSPRSGAPMRSRSDGRRQQRVDLFLRQDLAHRRELPEPSDVAQRACAAGTAPASAAARRATRRRR